MKTTLNLACLAAFCLPAVAQNLPVPGEQSVMSTHVSRTTSHNYLLYLPGDYAQRDKLPLMLFLHGAGERGDGELQRVKVHGPPKLIASGEDFPFIVVAPQCKAGGWWEAAELSALLDHIEATYKVDKDRIYVTGLSMGGFGTWALASYEPDRFAAIAPICGGGNHIAVAYRKPIKAAVWAFHGAKDRVVPWEMSEKMVAGLEKQEAEVKLTVYPDAGHDSWTETYNNEAIYAWLLKHRKQ